MLTGRKSRSPGIYAVKRWGFEQFFRFPVVMLERSRRNRRSLEVDQNPFALVVLAHLASQEAQTNEERFQGKVGLIRMLYARKYRRQDIIELFRFIDWLLFLPPEMEERLDRWILKFDREKAMPYVTSIERIGIRKGRKQGRQEGLARGREEELRETIETGLELRFGKKGRNLLPHLRKIKDLGQLRAIRKALFTADHVKQLEALLTTRKE